MRPVSGKGAARLTAAAIALLAGCGEPSQVKDASAKKSDAPPWSVSAAAEPAFAAPGWKAGDKTAWEEQIRQRNQSQNDYAR
jgi:hypothetical protein